MLSKCHSSDKIEKRRQTRGVTEVISKPQIVEEYNQHMEGVDMSEQQVLYYGYALWSSKWWKRVFFHLLDLALVNAHILFKRTSEKQLPEMDFRIEVTKGLLEGHCHANYRRHLAPLRELPLRLTERPFPEEIPKLSSFGGRPQCEVCRAKKKRSQTIYRCKTCKTPLHLLNCMEDYHTKINYS